MNTLLRKNVNYDSEEKKVMRDDSGGHELSSGPIQ